MALCGIACAGFAFVLHLHWPVWWHWLQSPAGLRTQAFSAMGFQLSGVVLIAREIWVYARYERQLKEAEQLRDELRKDFRKLMETFVGLTQQWDEIGAKAASAGRASRQADAARKRAESADKAFDMRFTLLEIDAEYHHLRLVAEAADPRGKTGWWGAALLLLGVTLSGTTDLFGIR